MTDCSMVLLKVLWSRWGLIGPKGMMIPLILLTLGVSAVYCDSHSLQCYETVVSSQSSGLPIYSIVAYVDDKMIGNFTSDTRHYLPKAEWVKQVEAKYWERQTQRSRRTQNIYTHLLQTLMRRFNETKGLHIYQKMFGCELRDDGSTAGYVQHGYDGRDYLYLDTNSGIFIPAMNQAQLTTERWNSPETKYAEKNKFSLENECLDYLKMAIHFGRKELEKRVRPEVKVWGRQSDGGTRLHCLVYGFHPRTVDVRWMRNETDKIISSEASPILPHPDGTYQIRVSVEVPTGEEDSYSCHVEHSSLEEDLIVKYNRRRNWRSWRMSLCSLFTVPVIMSIVLYVSRSDEVRIKKRWMILALSLYCVPSLSALLVYLKMSQEQSFY